MKTIKAHHSLPKPKIFPVQTPLCHTIVRPLAMVKRLYIENHTKPTLGDVHFNSPSHFYTKQPLYYTLLVYITCQALCVVAELLRSVRRELPSCSNMSGFTPRNIPSKSAVVCRVPTFCPKDDQFMLLHEKSYNNGGYKLEESCNNDVLQGSVVVPRGHDEVKALQKDSGREKLKRHREEIAGRVLIPDKWGKEELLEDWIDYSSFDSLLAPNGLASARKALIAEGRRMGSQRLRIESMC